MNTWVIDDVFKMEQLPPSACTLGFFDGIHLGHQLVFSDLKRLAQPYGLSTVALTFTNSLPPGNMEKSRTGFLSDPPLKARAMKELGINFVVLQEPGREFFGLSPEDFISDILVDKLNVKMFLAGPDLQFGKARAGNLEMMEKLGRRAGFDIEVVKKVEFEGEPISSSRIKTALLEGEISSATHMLGAPYSIQGEIVHGDKFGRTLGFPTANLEYAPDRLLPKFGVYLGHAVVSPGEAAETRFPAAINVGIRPTMRGSEPRVEAWLKGCDEVLYGKQARFSFEVRLRDEIRFESMDDLKERMAVDIQELDAWLLGNS